jgi:hypothetical protein
MPMGTAGGADSYPAPDDYAVVVGINRYREGITTLNGAVNDASNFARWLKDKDGGGLDPTHVTTMLGHCSEDGTKPYVPRHREFEEALIPFYNVNERTGQPVGRRLYIFMAGHGTALTFGNDCSLVLGDSYPNLLSLVTGTRAAEMIFKAPLFKEVVLFMACCQEVAQSNSNDPWLPPVIQPLANASYFHGIAVKWGKKAIERELPSPFDPTEPASWQSVFAHAVIQGLRSAYDDEGRITSPMLRNFVKSRVRELLPAADRQSPTFSPDDDEPIVFRERPPAMDARMAAGTTPAAALSQTAQAGTLTPVDIVVSDPAGAFEILDGKDLSRIVLNAAQVAQGVFRVYLKPSLYVLRAQGQAPQAVKVLTEPQRVVL